MKLYKIIQYALTTHVLPSVIHNMVKIQIYVKYYVKSEYVFLLS